MKRKTLATALLFAAMSGFTCASASETLLPKQSSFGAIGSDSRPFLYPLEELAVYFHNEVKISRHSKIYVAAEGKEAVLPVNVRSETFGLDGHTCGSNEYAVIIEFEKTLLPKGESYRLVLEKGSVEDASDPESVNPQIEIPFYVPADLGPAQWDIENGSVVDKATDIWTYWGFETKAVGDPKMELYCDGVHLKSVPAHVGWDWNLGQAYADFGAEEHFAKGAEYTLVLPAGSVSSLYRDDIVNEETAVHFVGGWEDTGGNQFRICGFRIDLDNETDELRSVSFAFDKPFELGPEPRIQVWSGDDKNMIAEAVAYKDTMINCFGLRADFVNVKLGYSENGYTFVIPAGTMISVSDAPCPNPRLSTRSDVAGVERIGIMAPENGKDVIFDLFGRQVSSPVKGQIYVIRGKKIIY